MIWRLGQSVIDFDGYICWGIARVKADVMKVVVCYSPMLTYVSTVKLYLFILKSHRPLPAIAVSDTTMPSQLPVPQRCPLLGQDSSPLPHHAPN